MNCVHSINIIHILHSVMSKSMSVYKKYGYNFTKVLAAQQRFRLSEVFGIIIRVRF